MDQELTRVTLNPAVRQLPVPFYLPQIGPSPITVNYSGDANFLPATLSTNLTATIGVTTIIAGAERLGSTAIVHARLTGSPVAAPTGTITISEPGLLSPKIVQLTDSGSGIAQAEVTLPNVSAGPAHVRDYLLWRCSLQRRQPKRAARRSAPPAREALIGI